MVEDPRMQEAPQKPKAPRTTTDERWAQHRHWLDVTGNEARQNRERFSKEPHEYGRIRNY